MDYKTKPIGRKDLRAISRWFRYQFKCKNKYRFDVIDAFEKIHSKFPQITTQIIDTDSTDIISDLDVPGTCLPDLKGNYHIVIRENIYLGACNGIGGYRAHVLHEMCHAVLCLFGFTPNLERTFRNNEIEPRYISMEWQAKALAGEILVPYEETIGMSERKIRFLCKVSQSLAKNRIYLGEHNGSDPNDYDC